MREAEDFKNNLDEKLMVPKLRQWCYSLGRKGANVGDKIRTQ